MYDSLQPHGLQHTRLPCPSPTPGVYSNSFPSHWWWHLTISSSDVPFSSCLQSFPASGSFQMSQFFASGGQSIKSFSFSISLSNEYSGLICFRIDWLDLLAVQGTPKSFLQHHSSKASILQSSAFKEKREKGNFLHYWWECNLIQSLWRRVSRFLKKLGNKTTKWPSNPTTGHILWGNHNWKGHMYPNMHHSNMDNSQDMEAT